MSLDFKIKYGSKEQKDQIMDRHADHLHIFRSRFVRSMIPMTLDQQKRMESAVGKFKRGDSNPEWLIAKTTSDPELHDHFASYRDNHTHLAVNPHIQKHHIDRILDDLNVPAHEALTTRKDLTPEHIDRLSKHSDPDVRKRLLDNHRDKLTPEQMKSAKQTGYLKTK